MISDPETSAEFVRLLTAHQRQIFIHILNFLPHAPDAEEVLQETNVVLWSKAGEFAAGSSFAAWACRVAHFQVLAFRKRSQRSRLTFSSELMDTFAEEMAQIELQDDARRSALAGCVEKLRDNDRDLISRRYVAGTTPQQIADETGRPPNSIYRSLERIRLLLLQCVRNALAAGD